MSDNSIKEEIENQKMDSSDMNGNNDNSDVQNNANDVSICELCDNESQVA